MEAARPRYGGSAEDLAAALTPFAREFGRSFIKWGEEAEVSQSKLYKDHVARAGAIAAAARQLQENLSFSKKIMEQAVSIVCEEHREAWHLKESDVPDYITTISRRLRNAFYHIMQGQRKKKQPDWFLEHMPWAVRPLKRDLSDGDGADTAAASAKHYTYAWNEELSLPIRVAAGIPDEIGFVVKPRAQEDDEAPLMARFDDGVTHAIDGITVGHWRALAGQRRQRVANEPLLVLEHAQTHHRLCVQQRCDRELLLSCYEQSRQILQCRVDRFGVLEEPQPRTMPNTHAAVQEAFRHMRPLIERYAMGELKTVDGLKAEHKRAMKALPSPTKVDKKKVRAADPPSEAKKPRHDIPNTRLSVKTHLGAVGCDAQPPTPREDGKPVAADAYAERLRRMKEITFIDEELEAHSRAGMLVLGE